MKKKYTMFIAAVALTCLCSLALLAYAEPAKPPAAPAATEQSCTGTIKGIDPEIKMINVSGARCKHKAFLAETDLSAFKKGDKVLVRYRVEGTKYIITAITKVAGEEQKPHYTCNGVIRAVEPAAKIFTAKGSGCEGAFATTLDIDDLKVNDRVTVKYIIQGRKKVAQSIEKATISNPVIPGAPSAKP